MSLWRDFVAVAAVKLAQSFSLRLASLSRPSWLVREGAGWRARPGRQYCGSRCFRTSRRRHESFCPPLIPNHLILFITQVVLLVLTIICSTLVPQRRSNWTCIPKVLVVFFSSKMASSCYRVLGRCQDKNREGWVDPGQAGGPFQKAAVKWVSDAKRSQSSYWK